MRFTRLMLIAFATFGCFALGGSSSTAHGQSLDETYDATRKAYDQTLNQLEQCDANFYEFQQMFKRERPSADAPKEAWDAWAKSYKDWMGLMTGCMRKLKADADVLKKKLEELQKQLDAIEADEEEKGPPAKAAKDQHEKAKELLIKGATDLEKWKLGLKVRVGQIHKMCGEASAEVEKHGSGRVKIEPYFKYDF
jgi:outer membrane murein-binding lipoprotein Lpp